MEPRWSSYPDKGLRPFSGDKAECPKCGNTRMDMEYCTKQHVNLEGDLDYWFATPAIEHLDRVCTRCGYGWLECCMSEIAEPKS